VVDERALDRMQGAVGVGQPFDRRHFAVHALPRQRQAGQHPPTVHVDRTGAALPLVAAFLGPGQPGVLPQGVEQRDPRFDRETTL
jgi:hypothetical protein